MAAINGRDFPFRSSTATNLSAKGTWLMLGAQRHTLLPALNL